MICTDRTIGKSANGKCRVRQSGEVSFAYLRISGYIYLCCEWKSVARFARRFPPYSQKATVKHGNAKWEGITLKTSPLIHLRPAFTPFATCSRGGNTLRKPAV